jgi:gamma-D-glutamyl-L-lysine dipeptidyl-peptidase
MSSTTRDAKKRLLQLVERVRAGHVPDARSCVFDIHVIAQDGGFSLAGHTTEPAAVDELLAEARRLLGADLSLSDDVVRLPHPELGDEWHAVATAAATPVYATPRLPSPQISEVVLGMRVDVLERRETWLRIRAEDGYIGWVHRGYVQVGGAEWAHAWERGVVGEPVVSLGANLLDHEQRPLAQAPWGARLIRLTPSEYELPDGRRGSVATGEVIAVDRLADHFPPRGDSIARTARRWIGTPYLWGGVTPGGADCSGFTQAVFWMHGLALPRDSDLQARRGALVESGDEFQELKPGDLVYFAERDSRITHVAISLGGTEIVHSAISNGGVELNHLGGTLPLEVRLRALFVEARRLLSD